LNSGIKVGSFSGGGSWLLTSLKYLLTKSKIRLMTIDHLKIKISPLKRQIGQLLQNKISYFMNLVEHYYL